MVSIIVTLVIIGVVLALVDMFILRSVDGRIRSAIFLLTFLCVLLWLLQALGFNVPGMGNFRL